MGGATVRDLARTYTAEQITALYASGDPRLPALEDESHERIAGFRASDFLDARGTLPLDGRVLDVGDLTGILNDLIASTLADLSWLKNKGGRDIIALERRRLAADRLEVLLEVRNQFLREVSRVL
jgi:hypothetical protein